MNFLQDIPPSSKKISQLVVIACSLLDWLSVGFWLSKTISLHAVDKVSAYRLFIRDWRRHE
jgi:hypothetical protein